MTATAARQDGLRRHNLGLVLRHVLDAPAPVSRADVAARTGLTRTTVSALVDRLASARMVAELPAVSGPGAGRPAVPLVGARATYAALGLEVNVSYLGARALDLTGAMVADRVETGDFHASSPDAVLPRLAALASAVVDELAAGGTTVVGAGIALPGLVDAEAGTLRLAPNLGWREVSLAPLLELVALPLVRTGNEASLAAVAAARSHPDPAPSFVYVSGEVGIGGGIVLDGELLRGRRGWAGEIGHTTVEPAGPPCACGSTGCLEQYAGRDALMLAAGLESRQPVEALVARARVGDGAALAAVQRAGWALGVALADAVNLLDVDEVLLGGMYALLADLLEPEVLAVLRSRVLSAPWSAPVVRAARDGQHGAMTGAALTVLAEVVADPAAWMRPSLPGVR